MQFRFALIALSAVVSVSMVSAQNVRTRFTKKVNLGGDTIAWFAVPLNNGGYAVLCTVNRAGRVDGVLSAYAANGATLWNQTVWSSYDFRPNGLLKTSNGDLIVVARARSQTDAFAYTARISSNGGTVWAHARQYGVGGGAYAGTIDQNDNIYITGSGKFSGFENAFAVKMNGAGTEVYQKYSRVLCPTFSRAIR